MKRFRILAVAGIAVAIASSAVLAAGNFLTYPIVGQGSRCIATISGAGGFNSAGTGGGGGATGQGQASSGSLCAQTLPAGPPFLTGNELVPADTQIGANGNPQTVTIPVTMLGNYGGTPRNFLGNGALDITNTNGTSTVTCATTSAATTAALSADRWMCDANVTSGAGRSAIVTSSPTPPLGFTNVMKVFRTSGALTQPICTWSAVPTKRATQLAGDPVTFSVEAAALAGLSADNGNVANLVIIAGTGTDEGLNASWTASPAITPAWTGITTVVNTPITLTTTFGRFATTATIPATATEVGVGLCFTPTATGAGATDGFAWTGAQLEIGSGASNFETLPQSAELIDAEQYFYKITEGAATVTRAMCMASSTTLAICGLKFPVPMYKAPTMSYTNGFATATTTAGSTLGACTTLRTSTLVAGNAASSEGVLVDCVATTVPAAGSADYLADNGGSGVINAWTGL